MTTKNEKPPIIQTKEPARAASLEADVLVPLSISLLSGALLAALLVFLIREVRPGLLQHPWNAWLLTMLAVASGVWLCQIVGWRELLWKVEKQFNIDITGDGVMGNPRRTLEVDARTTAQHWQYVSSEWLGIDDDGLIRLAGGLVAGRSLTEAEWRKDPAFPQGINQFRQVRSRLMKAGLLEKAEPGRINSSFVLTAAGRAVMRRLAEERK